MSPTPTNPAIVQIAKAAPGASASAFVPVSQAPGSSISCGLVPGAIGVFGELSVATETGGCRVSWANSGRNAQDKAPVTLRVTSGSTYTDSDFILEISNAAPGSPPTTVVTSNGQAVAQGSTLTFVVGTQYTVTFTSTDPDAGAIIRAQLVGVLPPGATLTGLGPSPTGTSLVSTFTWTPATPNQNGNVQLLVSDETNKQTTASFSFVVPADIVKPVVTVPADITEEAQSPAGRIVTYENYSPAPSASDNIDGTITPTCVPPSGSTFPLGATLVTCNATDAALNTGTASFTVTIVDTTRPVLGVPAPNVLVDATSEFGAPVTYTVTVTDAVTTGIVPMCTPESGSIFGFGSTTVTCNATDAAGNVGYASFMVTVTACAFGGFLPPVENPPQVDLVSTQQNLPLKWGMAGYWGMNILAPGYPRLVAVNCGTFADPDVPTDVPTDATITTSVLKYDTTEGRYMLGYSLKGRTVINTCYQLQLQFTTCPGRTFLALARPSGSA
ncbi:hypothetical protein HYH03_014188 [Edaphochlamys debaryana]|uniref:HYR domain-containing protein n=1 Tax=Edaphochlamys debaryana TaxID=47281 RepID=A0A835XPA1_9CHLO|nr:hypothetical protein HYH03_014188 [Edaphochlamys debaryana]|eukprot:KAG2487214.1 hypothetical protein HYH03_014188 [Edaphochlamys debaryana]